MAYQPDLERYQNTYRMASARRPGYDYGQTGAYFITICTAHRARYFGEIVATPAPYLHPTPVAVAALYRWLATAEHYPYATPGPLVVMPDHLHGIVYLTRPPDAPAWQTPTFGPQQHNLAAVVRGFKAAVTKWAVAHGQPFVWQSRFHDRIIRTDEEEARIAEYIAQNPARWADEHARPDGLFR